MQVKTALLAAIVPLLLSAPASAQYLTNNGRFVFRTFVAASQQNSNVLETIVTIVDTQTGQSSRCSAKFYEPYTTKEPDGKQCTPWTTVNPAHKLPAGTTYSWALQGSESIFKHQPWDLVWWAVDDKTRKVYVCKEIKPVVSCYLVAA